MDNENSQSAKGALNSELFGVDNPGMIASGAATPSLGDELASEDIDSSEVEQKTVFAEQTHQYIREYIQSADQKSTFYFAAFSAVVAFSNSENILGAWIVSISAWHLFELASLLSTVLLLLGVFGCLSVVRPRLGGSKEGLIFFNNIATFESQNDYLAEFSSKSPGELLEEKLKHTFELATVCKKKYQTLGISLWLGGIGFILLILLMLFS